MPLNSWHIFKKIGIRHNIYNRNKIKPMNNLYKLYVYKCFTQLKNSFRTACFYTIKEFHYFVKLVKIGHFIPVYVMNYYFDMNIAAINIVAIVIVPTILRLFCSSKNMALSFNKAGAKL